MLTPTEAALIRRVREMLEAVSDCPTPLVCGSGETECERCRVLAELDDLLAKQ